MVRREDNSPARPWETSTQRNKLNNPLQPACNESHNSHHSHAGRKSYCLSRSQQQLACSHIRKNLDFNRKWGCRNKHKFLSLVFMITKPPRRRDWRYHSTQSRCKGVGWKDPFRVCCSRRLWVKQVMLSAHTAGLCWLPFAVKSRKRCLQLAGLFVLQRGTPGVLSGPRSLVAFWPTTNSLWTPRSKEHCYVVQSAMGHARDGCFGEAVA